MASMNNNQIKECLKRGWTPVSEDSRYFYFECDGKIISRSRVFIETLGGSPLKLISRCRPENEKPWTYRRIYPLPTFPMTPSPPSSPEDIYDGPTDDDVWSDDEYVEYL